eukprot:6199054-Pleurochrysis_carterae.AAC.4
MIWAPSMSIMPKVNKQFCIKFTAITRTRGVPSWAKKASYTGFSITVLKGIGMLIVRCYKLSCVSKRLNPYATGVKRAQTQAVRAVPMSPGDAGSRRAKGPRRRTPFGSRAIHHEGA